MKLFTRLLLSVAVVISSFSLSSSQVSFVNSNDQLQGATHSGCPVTVVDVNGDGLDDIVRLDQAHKVYIDYQRPGQQFSHDFVGDFGGSSGWAWAMCVADVDHNGFKDVIAGSYGPSVKLLKLDNTGLSGSVSTFPNSSFFVQNMNFMDVNNDGWEDIFACDDDAESHIWVNDGTGNFNTSSIIDFDVTNTDDSGNYGSVWSDFDNDGDVDFYIAKCRQGVNDPSDGRRIDVLFVNDGNNGYTEDALSYGLADSGETWTCNFADIDNDGDLDAIEVDQDVPVKLLENDGTGHMTNISAGSGFALTIYPIESVMEDFDNDGFVDILVTGGNSEFFHNNGNHTFTKLSGLFDSNHMESFAIGDLNHDGKIDIYASYALIYTTPTTDDDVYWMNTSENGNHFITFNLIGSTSNEGALGAKVTIYGSWGKQIREVHAGESYGTCNSTNLHFGLGAATSIDSAVVHWPSGIVTTLVGPAIDQFITIKEGSCVSPPFSITSDNPLFAFCTGQSLTLTASSLPAGYSYLWSDGSTDPSLVVSSTGTYDVTAVSANNDCSVNAPAVMVVENPDETPVISASGDLVFCEGDNVILSSPAASSYAWSNGESTQSISVTQSGSYSVTIQGLCQQWTSQPVDVIVLASPAPATTGAVLGAPGNATVTATGDDISWYDVPTGGAPVATGNSYTTFVSATDTFYAQDEHSYGADTLYTGQTYHTGSSLYSASASSNYYLIFDVVKACKLKSVKVYTDIPGERLIEWRNSSGNVIQSALIDIPVDTSKITLDFDLTPGTDYQLGTNAAQNEILLGADGPHLERSNSGVNYPYAINDLVSVNNSSFGSTAYYYFYDWEVWQLPTVCLSARTPAIVELATEVNETNNSNGFEFYPNPTEDHIIIRNDEAINETVNIKFTDATGRLLLNRSEAGLKPGQQIQLDLAGFSKGIYFVDVQSGSNSMQHKVVIQ